MFEIIECKTANEFLDILNPINPLKRGFPDNEKEAFLYRGQEDASFKLLPACFRTYCDKKTFESIVSYKDLVLKEYDEFEHFIESSEYIELVKEGIFKLKKDLLSENYREDLFSNPFLWPPKNIYDSLFLAQHHGAATRMLDWSKDVLAAIYFACQPILWDKREDSIRLNGNIAVWCYLPNNANESIIVENRPSNYDKNMIAQNGRYILIKQKITDTEKNFKIITLDDIEDKVHLWKVTVPKEEVFTLLSYCDSYKINAETIYKGRGLDCVAMSYREKIIWKDRKEKIKSPYQNGLIDGLSEV